MAVTIPAFNCPQMPVVLGSPLRVPHYAWPNWGITCQTAEESQTLMEASEQEYRGEWDTTNPMGHAEIAQAAVQAGLGDANALLNTEIGRIATGVFQVSALEPLSVLDLGAGTGGTTMAVSRAWEEIHEIPMKYTLVDPAAQALRAAEQNLSTRFHGHLHASFFTQTDHQFLKSTPPATFDLLVAGAAIHHHSDIRPLLALCFGALVPGGFAVIGDWHNSMWEHPYRVLQLLETMDWPRKAEDLRLFRRAYPLANQHIELPLANPDQLANSQIQAFWAAYARVHRPEVGRFVLLEGHRPVKKYIEDLSSVGFEVPSKLPGGRDNPTFIIGGSSLLAVTVAIKPTGGHCCRHGPSGP